MIPAWNADFTQSAVERIRALAVNDPTDGKEIAHFLAILSDKHSWETLIHSSELIPITSDSDTNLYQVKRGRIRFILAVEHASQRMVIVNAYRDDDETDSLNLEGTAQHS